jgi:hypothetical protein
MAKLATYVYVRDESGKRFRFGPGDDVPSWASKKITNPAAWAGGTPEAPEAEEKPAKRKAKPREGTPQDAPSPAPQGTAQATADAQAAKADAKAAE